MKANYIVFLSLVFLCFSCDDGIIDPDPGSLPNADFTFQVQANNPRSVDFESNSTGADTLIWDFGDGTRSTEKNATKEYEENGTYQVSLTAVNIAGVNTITQQVVIDGANAPEARFEVSFDEVTSSLQVGLANTSTFTDAVEWDFGDGNLSTDPNLVSHTYAMAGTYTIRLTASSNDERLSDSNRSNTTSVEVTVLDNAFLHGSGTKTWRFTPGKVQFTYDFTVEVIDSEGDTTKRPVAIDTLVSSYHVLRADTLFFEVELEDCMLDDRFTFNASGDYLTQNNGDGRLIERNGQCGPIDEPGETNWLVSRDDDEFTLITFNSYIGDSEVGFFYRIVELTDDLLVLAVDVDSPIIGEPRTIVMAFEPI